MLIYSSINILIKDLKGLPEGSTVLNVEPILYGVFFVIVDMAIISIKNITIKVYKKMKKI